MFFNKEQKKQPVSLVRMTGIALMAAICCILGPVAIPIGPVPVSLSTMAVFLSVYALGQKDGTAAVGLYIILGLFGLPVFSGFAGGPAKLLGPTGGYIIGFLFLAWIAGWFIGHFPKEKAFQHIVGMLLGEIVLYIFGTTWFMILMHVGAGEALALCVWPFLPFDMIKILLSVMIGIPLRRQILSLNRSAV